VGMLMKHENSLHWWMREFILEMEFLFMAWVKTTVA